MQSSLRQIDPVWQRGSWIPHAELRPNLWLAEHEIIGGQVLLEVFAGAAGDQELRARLLEHNELAHSGPGFARVIEVLVDGGDLLAAIECAGKPLSDVPGPLDAGEVAEIGAGVGRALARMHTRGRVHGVLWTGSVYSGRRGSGAVLMDLGWGAPIGHAAAGLGGWNSLAPENRVGGPLTEASDVWGLGTLLFSLATNRFWNGSRADLAGIDSRLAAAIDGCLAPDPRDRFGSAEDVVAALADVGVRRLSLVNMVIEAPEPEPAPEVVFEIDDREIEIEIVDREPPLSAEEAWGEHADWFIEDDQPLTEEQMIGLYGFKPPLSPAARGALCCAATGAALASTLGLALIGVKVLG